MRKKEKVRQKERSPALLILKVYRERRKSARTPSMLLYLINRGSIIDLFPSCLSPNGTSSLLHATIRGINYNNTARAASDRANVTWYNAILRVSFEGDTQRHNSKFCLKRSALVKAESTVRRLYCGEKFCFLEKII